MGLFSKRKSRATRRAEARALKRRAKLDAKYAARNEKRRIKSAERSADKALRAQIKAQRDSDKAALKVAETNRKAVRGNAVVADADSPNVDGDAAACAYRCARRLPDSGRRARLARRATGRPARSLAGRRRQVLP